MSSVKKVIGVVSGKGGVGKSIVTAMLAVLLKRRGYNTAVLDADITGPSIPKVFGIKERAQASEFGLLPAKSKFGTDIMSVNMLLGKRGGSCCLARPDHRRHSQAVLDRCDLVGCGLYVCGYASGTGDVPLTVFQSLPLDGIIVVTSPQELVSMIVAKAVNMAKLMDIPILGVVENMSYVECPDCGKKILVFGESHVEEAAKKYNLQVLGKIPMTPDLARSATRVSSSCLKAIGWITQLTSSKI